MEDMKSKRGWYIWNEDAYNKSGMADEERIDEVVGKVVRDLDSVEVLQLGVFKSFQKPEYRENWEYEDEWGQSARWMEIVRKRAEERLLKRTL